MSKSKHRESAPIRRIRPASCRIGGGKDRRGPRPWTRDEQRQFLNHLASHATLSEALAAACVDRRDAWAERLRNADFARAWDRCLADRIIRLPELLLEHVIHGLASDSEPTVRQSAAVGQWLVEKCLPLVSRYAAAEQPTQAPRRPSPSASPDPAANDREIGMQIAAIRQRLAAAGTQPPPAEPARKPG